MNKTLFKKLTVVSLTILALLVFAFSLYNFYFLGKIFPGIYIAEVYVGGLTPHQALNIISQEIETPAGVVISGQNQIFELETSSFNFQPKLEESVSAAYNLYRTGNIFFDLYERLLAAVNYKKQLGLRISVSEEALYEIFGVIAESVGVDSKDPGVFLKGQEVIVEKGNFGEELDKQKLRIQIGSRLSFAENEPIEIPTKRTGYHLTDEEAEAFKKRAENLLGKALVLRFRDQEFSFKENAIFKFLDPKKEYKEKEILEATSQIATRLDREPQNPVFVISTDEVGKIEKVREFTAARDGIKVKKELLKNSIVGNLRSLEIENEKSVSVDIPAEVTPPKFKTSDVNNLGIRKLIGRGSSRFAGSIPERIHNISQAASKFKGILIAPNETLSFNEILGDVSIYTGYKQAFIIKDGKTVLGDGGGVCQVSSTLFRASLNAGLPIIERQAHSYRVGYYEQDSPPGLDATVYAPTVDLKIKNDTEGHILIQPVVDTNSKTLTFEIYGTSDGRVSLVSKPVVTDLTAPPEDLYTDDPTLASGRIKQIDYKAWGAKVKFGYKVERGGETIFQKTFYSNYRPWQAVFLRGTRP